MFGLKILPRFYRLIRREYYIKLDGSQLFLNFLVQRIFRLNSEVPFSLHYTSRFQGFKNMRISSKETLVCCAVSGGCYFTAFDGTTLEIGDGTYFAFNVCLQTGNHKADSMDEYETASIKIGRNCWLGNGAVVVAGVTLGDHVIVGANSVVTKSFPSNVLIAGTPAQVIRELNEYKSK